MKYFVLDYNKVTIGESGEACKSSYDLSLACKKCGTGATLQRQLRTIKLGQVSKDFFATLDDDYIISERLYNYLKEEGIKLGKLNKIVNFKNIELPFYHLYSTLTLPPATKKDGLTVENQCSECKRNGYFNTAIFSLPDSNIPTKILPYDLHYQPSDMEIFNQIDFAFTWECMGLSNLKAHGNFVVRYARPLLVVSEKFKLTLEKLKIKGVEFEQIIID
nr:hypothetical protein [uncultured Bacteroides sp.]